MFTTDDLMICKLLKRIDQKWFYDEWNAFLSARCKYLEARDPKYYGDYASAFQVVDSSLKQLLSWKRITSEEFFQARTELMEEKDVQF